MRLFVGGLDYATDEDELKRFFETRDDVQVTDVRIIRDRERENRSKGFGFVSLNTSLSVAKIVDEYHHGVLAGRKLTVNQAVPKPEVVERARR